MPDDPANKTSTTADTGYNDAVDFMRLVQEAESFNRTEFIESMKFRFGDQWPSVIQNSRTLQDRPMMTINETDAYVRQISNRQRKQRPRIDPHPTGGQASVDVAKVLKGLIRHVEVNSDADYAYWVAGDYAASAGWGYIRVLYDYVNERSFDLDIYVEQIENPLTVYFDPGSRDPAGADARKCLVTDMMHKDVFRQLYPSANEQSFGVRGAGDTWAEWVDKDFIRVAEFFDVLHVKDTLIELRTPLGIQTIFESEYLRQKNAPGSTLALLTNVLRSRPSYRREVVWRKVTAFETLRKMTWAGRLLPIIPVYGRTMVVDGKRRRFGMVQMARDPQRMVNYWQTSTTESIAMAPKAKWLVEEGSIEGYETEWDQANNSPKAYLPFKAKNLEGAPIMQPPQRIQPEPPPEGSIQAAFMASSNLQRVMGVYDPNVKPQAGTRSGKAVVAEQQESDDSNFDLMDNLRRSLKQVGRVILDLAPKVWRGERMMRIIGEDGKAKMITINQRKEVDGIQRIQNDLTVGDYDVDMDTGPAFNTKRIEFTQIMAQMLQGNEQLWQIAGDLIFRNLDFPDADVIADRLAAANPYAQIDEENSEIPPKVQMQLKGQQAQIEQLQQQLQQAGLVIKSRSDVEAMREAAETHRVTMRESAEDRREDKRLTVKAHDVASTNATKQFDTKVRALSAQHVEEIRGLVELLHERLSGAQNAAAAERQIEHETAQSERQIEAASAAQPKE